MKRVTNYILIFCTFFSINSFIYSETIKVGVYNNSFLSYKVNNNDASGLFINVLKKSFYKSGYKIKFVFGSFSQCLILLKNGAIDILPVIASSKERLKEIIFNKNSIFENWGQIFALKENINCNVIDLKGKNIAVLADDIHYKNGIVKLLKFYGISANFIETDSYEGAIKLVETKKADYCVLNRLYTFKQFSTDIKPTQIVFNPITILFGFNKNSAKYIDLIDKKIQDLKSNGEITKLLNEDVIDYQDHHNYYVTFFTAFIIIYFLLLVIYVMKKIIDKKTKELQKINFTLQRDYELIKLSEKKYNENFNWLNKIKNSVQNGIVIIGYESGKIIDVNDKMSELLKYSKEELLTLTCNDIACDENQCPFKISNVEKSEKECDIKDKFGNLIPVFKIATLFENYGQKYIVESVTDISKLKATENSLIRAERLASIGMISSGIAHEYNNLLTPIIGNIELIFKKEKLNDYVSNKLSYVLKASKRAADITEKILNFTKISSKEFQYSKISLITAETLSFVKNDFESSGITLKLDFKDKKEIFVMPKLISQVILNLIINASHAVIDSNNPIISLKTYENSENEVCLDIIDNGVGISKEELTQIFKPFYSTKGEFAHGNSSFSKVKGTGLGLSFCEKIINDNKGKIIVSSKVGVGTTFSIHFPIAENTEINPNNMEYKDTKVSVKEKKYNIMIVDDEELVSDILSEILLELGHSVYIENDPLMALEKLKNSKFDFITLDLQMPQMNGFEFAETYHDNLEYNQCPIVVVTGRIDNEEFERIKSFGVIDVITKPFDIEKIEEFFNKFELQKGGLK